MDNTLVIGIDLGTTNSCASYFIDGNVKALENQEGSRVTPSFIHFTNTHEYIVGEHAKSMADITPQNGVYEVKRLIGKQFSDPHVQKSIKNWPFKVIRDDEDNTPMIEIETETNRLLTKPVEMTTLILQKLKYDVEEKLGTTIEKVVITVPANFNKSQREDTLTAAKDAGFVVLKLLNEPTAAALIYYFNHPSASIGDHCLVYNLGGGTFDVVILKRTKDKIVTVAVDGHTDLAGHDFDNNIISYICEQLSKDHNHNARSNPRDIRRLHKICENAKKTLSSSSQTVIVLEGVVPNKPAVHFPLTRAQFEDLNEDLFKETITIVDRCLKKAKLEKSDIKEVVLAGGSTRIPIIQKLLSKYFDNRKLNKFIHPDECVAEGAALQGAMLSKNPKQKINCIQITDVTPLSLGVYAICGKMEFLIKKNTAIPITAILDFITTRDKQAVMCFNIYEGERLEACKNYYLGSIEILDITPAPPGMCTITLTLEIDENGILTATAKEKYGTQVKSLKITYAKGHRSDWEINSALVDAVENALEDKKFEKFVRNKIYLTKYCIRCKYNLDTKQLRSSCRKVYDQCEDILKLIEDLHVKDEKIILDKTKEIKAVCEPLVKRHRFELMP